MKFNKHNNYRQNKTSIPDCPRCKTNANVVQLSSGFRCAFCGERFYKKEGSGQQRLNL